MEEPEFDKNKAETYEKMKAARVFPDKVINQLRKFSWYKRRSSSQDLSEADQLNVLDYGCGTGLCTMQIVDDGHLVTAVDVSSHMLDVFRRKLVLHETVAVKLVHLPAGDGSELPRGNFDLILLSYVLHHVEPQKRSALVENLKMCLRPQGGRLLLFEFLDTDQSREAFRELQAAKNDQDTDDTQCDTHCHGHAEKKMNEAHHLDGQGQSHHRHYHWLNPGEVKEQIIGPAGLHIEEDNTFQVENLVRNPACVMDCYFLLASTK
eukprot:CAMPEP_0184687958 /NCGR_PEP_ID=MMETSP0312-20130426/28105_1 /TAXON_ID=31354 /ORGANISM="Compsopogon coeruleus, Strain SAG 36.94" /LENGTH=263 /DNA_ID=CAMNT_0027144609 /DNA_START=98 /DNA_END=889 /DNA_ORIENTATION=-